MVNWMKKSDHKTGKAPGSLIYVGEAKKHTVTISQLTFGPQGFVSDAVDDLATFLSMLKLDDTQTCWITLTGVHEKEPIEVLGQHFNLHPLVLEDIMHTDQRPKIEMTSGYIYIPINMIQWQAKEEKSVNQQLNLVLLPNVLVLFQENPEPIFDSVQERIKHTRWRDRGLGADYLMYALLDAVVDYYFVVLENIAEEMERLEHLISAAPQSAHLDELQRLRKSLIFMRKALWPFRTIVNEIIRNEHPLLGAVMKDYCRDLNDHVVQAMETTETLRETLSSLHDLYMSSVSNKMNQVMKVLTIIATLFIPPTFIAGIYGMNFERMPELQWSWGYVGALGLMLAIMLAMIGYFKWKKWW